MSPAGGSNFGSYVNLGSIVMTFCQSTARRLTPARDGVFVGTKVGTRVGMLVGMLVGVWVGASVLVGGGGGVGAVVAGGMAGVLSLQAVSMTINIKINKP
jgi:hypothetical protein